MVQKKWFGFSQNVFALSVISFLNDIGGETIKRAIPLYLFNALGAKTSVIGLIEGIAESTPQLLQPLSGYLSDKSHKRKPLIIGGQILRTSMLLLFWAVSWPIVLILRFLDRSGKGLTDAPRDALISSSSEDHHVGRAFGLNRAFDNGGAVVGMVFASILVLVFAQGSLVMSQALFQRIVLLAVVPLIVSLIIMILFIRDVADNRERLRIELHNKLGSKFYLFLLLSFLFTLGNSSDAFLILRAQAVGLTLWQIFLLLAGYSLVSSVSGYPLSSLSDRIGRKKLLITGWLIYSVVYFLFAHVASGADVIGLFLLYGLYYGFTEGAAKAYVSDIIDPGHKGTAFGIYNMVTGVTLLPASLFAGFLWQAFYPAVAFYFGSAMALISALGLLLFL